MASFNLHMAPRASIIQLACLCLRLDPLGRLLDRIGLVLMVFKYFYAQNPLLI